MDTTILTEHGPRMPGTVHHPGAYLVGAGHSDRGAEYGAPAVTSGVVAFTPQHAPGRADNAGSDEHAPSLGDIIGPAPAIGEIRR